MEKKQKSKKEIISIEETIERMQKALDDNEILYEEVHDQFERKAGKKKEKLNEMMIGGDSRASDGRNTVELAKVLSTIRSTAISGSKALFDAVKENELLSIKREEVELRREALNKDNENKFETNELLRSALLASKDKANDVAQRILSENDNKDLAMASKKLLDRKLENEALDLSDREKEVIMKRKVPNKIFNEDTPVDNLSEEIDELDKISPEDTLRLMNKMEAKK